MTDSFCCTIEKTQHFIANILQLKKEYSNIILNSKMKSFCFELAIATEILLLLCLLNTVWDVFRQAKHIIRNGREETKLLIFTNDVIVHKAFQIYL